MTAVRLDELEAVSGGDAEKILEDHDKRVEESRKDCRPLADAYDALKLTRPQGSLEQAELDDLRKALNGCLRKHGLGPVS